MNTNLPKGPIWPGADEPQPEPKKRKTENLCSKCHDVPKQPKHDTCFGCMTDGEKEVFVQEATSLSGDKWKASSAYRKAQRKSTRRIGQNFAKDRRNGALVIYPDLPGVQIPTIYTPKTCCPYPAHRRKHKLKGSYPTGLCIVVFPGWPPGKKNEVVKETKQEE